MNDFEKVLPAHKASLSITHNQHKDYYETIEQYVASYAGYQGIRDDDWVSLEEKRRSVETGEIWEIQWYPETPVGFCIKFAATLAALMAWCESAR